MAEILKCPSCGASDAEKKSETEYVCNFCESQFIVGQKRKQTTVDDALRQMHQYTATSNIYNQTAVKPFRLVGLMIAISIMGIVIGVSIYLANTVNTTIENGPGKMGGDEYWNEGSTSLFYIFEGDKGPMCWMLINQSSKKLDSTKYTLQLVNPMKKSIEFEKHFITMTWNESFNFRNYLSEMISANGKVYFLSETKGINVYDLYSGKLMISNEKFAIQFPELKSGIVSAKSIHYKSSIELMTNDGFKFYYLPNYNILVDEKKFNDYQSVQNLIGGFAVYGDPRQKLYYIISKQDTLRTDLSISDYYLEEYLRKGKLSQSKEEKGFYVDSSQTFFNVNYLMRIKNQVVFSYTENVAKDSKAYIISYNEKNLSKYLWKIELKSIKGFENAIKEGYYLRTSFSNKELAIWYESATKKAFGLDLKSGKINWDYSIN